LLDPRLLQVPGYTAGSTIILVYYMGLTGIWLVFALFLQDGLGYPPLRSGLTVTPFALGVAVSAVVAGRLVPRCGRALTVCGLATTGLGLAVTAVVVRQVSGPGTEWAVAGPLLLAGLGGGMVASPNMTLTLASVPVPMAGAAGGALQTGQRIGAAVGTAALAAIFYAALSPTRRDYRVAISDALLGACGFLLLSLTAAVVELVRRRSRGAQPAPAAARPEYVAHQL
jgi:MFS family permease